MKSLLSLLLLLASVLVSGCAGSKAAQDYLQTADLVIEVRDVDNDSIAVMVGPVLKIHVTKFRQGAFFPFLISVRTEADPETPILTDVVNDDRALLNFLQSRRGGKLSRIAILLGVGATGSEGFSERAAVDRLAVLVAPAQPDRVAFFRSVSGGGAEFVREVETRGR